MYMLSGDILTKPVELPQGAFKGFLSPSQVNKYLKKVERHNPEITLLQEIGKTFEGRPIFALCVGCCRGENSKYAPQSFFNAMHHAREPEGMMSILVFLQKFLFVLSNQGNAQFSRFQTIAKTRQVWLLPLLNVDGYEWNSSNKLGSLQRKNMRPTCLESKYAGVDLNRNYDVCFTDRGDGSSSDGCSDIYRGKHSFSEPETIAIRDFVKSHDFKIVLNFHSYGKDILIPYSCKRLDREPKDMNELRQEKYLEHLANNLGERTGYSVGKAYDPSLGLYSVNGDFADYVLNKLQILALSIEVGGKGFYPKNVMELTREPVEIMLYTAERSGSFIYVKEISRRQSLSSNKLCFSLSLINEGMLSTSSNGDELLLRLIVDKPDGRKIVYSTFIKNIERMFSDYSFEFEIETINWANTETFTMQFIGDDCSIFIMNSTSLSIIEQNRTIIDEFSCVVEDFIQFDLAIHLPSARQSVRVVYFSSWIMLSFLLVVLMVSILLLCRKYRRGESKIVLNDEEEVPILRELPELETQGR